ncbi:DUF4139 domain-containing protein [Hymenobacter busanensis]|uniref:DUF4139 domain-containing protein n=1 Tax=Hymenobacter busanensis TaxID=2607656 RepID=UPI0013675A92|nr:DUF4139 domain-containing protein [Hymenobacter busanensis]QHJ08448.1 DUF4139 domain-containing protein [Hymenobacter busanensis]
MTLSIGAYAQTPAPIVVSPELKAVTLYLNRAELTQQGTVALPAGTSTVRVRGLSNWANQENMEIRFGGEAELMAVGGEAADLPPGPINRAAQDSLTRAAEELERVKAELKALEEERTMWLSNRTLPTGTQASWSAELQKGATLLRTRLVAIQLETNKLTAQQTNLVNQMALLGNRVGQAAKTSNDVVLTVRAARAGTVPLTVRYFTENPERYRYWTPVLDIRADDAARKLNFVMRAQLHNRSFLDWQRVKLTLVNQTLGEEDVSRPELAPWELDFDGNDNVGEGRVDEFRVKGTATGRAAEVVQSTRYVVAEPLTLASNRRRTIELPSLPLQGTPEFLALPKLSDKVFLQTKVTGWEGLQLPEEAKVYHRGAYVGDTKLETRAYNDSLEVSLGFDDRIIVNRAKVEDLSGKAGLSNNRRVRLTYELNVRNLHPEAVRVRVLDQVPISEEKEIQVKVLDTSGAQLDAQTGKLTWIVPLAANTNKKLRFSFEVEYPQDKPVEIINHRVRISSPKFR